MRLNRYLAGALGISRRRADSLIAEGDVQVNGQAAQVGQQVTASDRVTCNDRLLSRPPIQTIGLHKPAGYVCSRAGQGNRTIYDLLPSELHHLKPVGRLDKDSSGLLLLTNDGQLADQLTHPRYRKEKVYEVELDKPLTEADQAKLRQGVKIENYVSRLRLSANENCKLITANCSWHVVMSQGRNRQIRRTFAVLGYEVVKLHRTRFGRYSLLNIPAGQWQKVD